jgi:O-antigen biosynthesis protein
LLEVGSGYVLSNYTIGNGVTVELLAGGRADNLDVTSGGVLAFDGGSIAGVTIEAGGIIEVMSGITLSQFVLGNGTLKLLGGGTAVSATVSAGALETISSGAVDSHSLIEGEQDVYGSAVGAIIDGQQLVYGTALGTILDGGAVQYVESGGVASGTIVSAGDEEVVKGGGSAVSTTVLSDGTLDLLGGAIVSDWTLSAGAALMADNGYQFSGFAVSSGLLLEIAKGGKGIDTAVAYGGSETVLSGGSETVLAGAAVTLSGTETINNGGLLLISGGPGAVSLGGSPGPAGTLTIAASGSLTNSGTLRIVGGSFAHFVGLDSLNPLGGPGGSLAVMAQALLTNDGTLTVGGGFGAPEVASGGSGSMLTVSSGGTLINNGSLVVSGGIGGGPFQSGLGGLGGTATIEAGATLTDTGTIVVSGGAAARSLLGDTGGTGGYVLDAGSLVNSGTIAVSGGAGGSSADNPGGSGGLLEIASGGLLVDSGSITIGGGIAGTNGGSDGTGASFTVDASGLLDVVSGGSIVVSSGGSALDSGTVRVEFGGSANGLTVVAGGLMEVESGGTVTDIMISGGTLDVLAGGNVSGAITFASNNGTLQIDGTDLPTDPATLIGGVISGLAPGDTIDLTGIAYDKAGSIDLEPGDVLRIVEDGKSYDLQLAGNFAGEYFHLGADPFGTGTLITEDNSPCYCPGTLIRTQAGERPVERLAIGDLVLTKSGALRPIKWIGRRSYGGRFIQGRADILPVCIKAGALAEQVPARDLFVSPHHAMYLETDGGGVLVEAKDLVNGASIVQARAVEAVEYFHIELDTHDVIIAEGALSETYLEDDNRRMFHNAHEYAALYPEYVHRTARYCAPRLDQGYELEAVRQRLAGRAGLPDKHGVPPLGALCGYIDLIDETRICGWAQTSGDPEAVVCLDLYIGGAFIASGLANAYRSDLERAGLGSGCHAFSFATPPGLRFDVDAVEVRRSIDGAPLRRSAAVLRRSLSAA